MRWLVALMLGCVACGQPAPLPSDGSKTADVNTAACGSIGAACGNGCPSNLECHSNVCVPVRGDCGGFAGASCQDTSLTCTYPTGSSAGICMNADEKACVCAVAPNALGDCTPP
jgi:hypothetical protein